MNTGNLKGGNLPLIKQQNYILTKKIIYRDRPISRSEIAQKLNLTAPTITSFVNHMLASGLLHEFSPLSSDSSRNVGRKPVMLDYISDAYLVLGIEVGPYNTSAVLIDLHGKIIDSVISTPMPDRYEEALKELTQLIQQFLTRVQIPISKLLGIGLVLPGFINRETGKIYHSIREEWVDHYLATDLIEALGTRVVIENNVRGRAICADLFDRSISADPMAYFFVSRGLACPVIIDGDILSGQAAGAGEIGHTIVDRDGPICEICGHRGCLDAVASQSAVLKRCRTIMRSGIDTILNDICPDPDKLNIDMVLQAQEYEDKLANTVIRDCIRYLGITLANVINFLSPRAILVDAHMMNLERNREFLLSCVLENIYAADVRTPPITFVPKDSLRGARGAAAVALKSFLLDSPDL